MFNKVHIIHCSILFFFLTCTNSTQYYAHYSFELVA